tara:strand:+ start:582 stop:758 length:177 start_codon:yes stop_codon:yes gene_type:complete
MLRTNYIMKSFEEWMLACRDFDDKLEIFKTISDCNAKVKMFVGPREYGIEITITNEKD